MIPMQEHCNPDDPEEFALWALVGIEETPNVPMITTEPALRSLSKQLAEAGFRHHPELQTRKAVIIGAPDVEGVHWMGTGAIQWVDMDYEDPVAAAAMAEPKVDTTVLSPAQKIALADDLRAEGVIADVHRPPELDDPPIVGRAGDDG